MSPDCRRLVTGTVNGLVRLWDLAIEERPSLELQGRSRTEGACFSSDGQCVLGATSEAVQVWNVQSGELIRSLVPQTNKLGTELFACRFSGDGQRILIERTWATQTNAAFRVFEAQVWDLASGQPLSPPLQTLYREFIGPRPHCAFSRDLSRVLVVREGLGQVWDLTAAKPIGPPLKHGKQIWYAAFSPDHRLVATSSDDRTALVWDATTGTKVAPPFGCESILGFITFSLDGRQLAAGASGGAVHLWDPRTSRLITSLRGHSQVITHPRFASDGRRLLTLSADGYAGIWDTKTGKLLAPFLKAGSSGVQALSPDGLLVVTTDNTGVPRVWDAATGGPISPPLLQPLYCYYAEFSPNSRRLLVPGAGNKLRVFELTKDERPLDDLLRLAQLLSAQRIDASGGVMTVEPSVLSNSWQYLRRKYPDQFVPSEGAILAWQQQHEAAVKQRQ
jgi:WD40 repeat protein